MITLFQQAICNEALKMKEQFKFSLANDKILMLKLSLKKLLYLADDVSEFELRNYNCLRGGLRSQSNHNDNKPINIQHLFPQRF